MEIQLSIGPVPVEESKVKVTTLFQPCGILTLPEAIVRPPSTVAVVNRFSALDAGRPS